MMANGGRFPYYESRELDCGILGFPYKQNQSTMYIILPHNSNRQKLVELQEKLTGTALEDLISHMTIKTSVILLPKLHLDAQINLRDTLMRLGVKTLFEPRQSDLSLISGVEEASDSKAQSSIDDRIDNRNDYLIFSRLAEEEGAHHKKKRDVTYKTESKNSPLTIKDLVIKKRITKSFPSKKRIVRSNVDDPSADLKTLDQLRLTANIRNAGLFADDVLHRVNLIVNERGTEAGAGKIYYIILVILC